MASGSIEARWLDALEAGEGGDRTSYASIAEEVVQRDPDHVDALWALVDTSLPPIQRGRRIGDPDLATAAKALSRCRRIVELDPDHAAAWMTGGSLLTEDLGMFHQALAWWDDRRAIAPNELMPLVEQVGILTRFGYYIEASERLERLFDPSMDEPSAQQMVRLERMYQEVKGAAGEEPSQFFRPWDPQHEGWERIRMFQHRKPTTQTYWLVFVVLPFLWIEAILWNRIISAPSMITTIAGFLIIFISFIYGSRFANRITKRINRPAQHLERAIDVESDSGKVCIPDGIRASKLGLALIGKRTKAFRARHEKIVDAGESLPKNWKLQVPDWFEEE